MPCPARETIRNSVVAITKLESISIVQFSCGDIRQNFPVMSFILLHVNRLYNGKKIKLSKTYSIIFVGQFTQ